MHGRALLLEPLCARSHPHHQFMLHLSNFQLGAEGTRLSCWAPPCACHMHAHAIFMHMRAVIATVHPYVL